MPTEEQPRAVNAPIAITHYIPVCRRKIELVCRVCKLAGIRLKVRGEIVRFDDCPSEECLSLQRTPVTQRNRHINIFLKAWAKNSTTIHPLEAFKLTQRFIKIKFLFARQRTKCLNELLILARYLISTGNGIISGHSTGLVDKAILPKPTIDLVSNEEIAGGEVSKDLAENALEHLSASTNQMRRRNLAPRSRRNRPIELAGRHTYAVSSSGVHCIFHPLFGNRDGNIWEESLQHFRIRYWLYAIQILHFNFYF